MKLVVVLSVFVFACASCGRVPEKKDPLEEELVTPEQKEAIEKFGERTPEA